MAESLFLTGNTAPENIKKTKDKIIRQSIDTARVFLKVIPVPEHSKSIFEGDT
jgi:hypothetical protein